MAWEDNFAAFAAGFAGQPSQAMLKRQQQAEYEELQRRAAELKQQQDSAAARGLAAQYAFQNPDQPRIDPNVAMGLAQIQEGLGTQAAFQAMQNPAFNPAVARQQAEAELAAVEQQMGRWGTGLDFGQFDKIKNAVATYSKGIGNARFISDVISATTPAQMRTQAMAGTRGRLETTMFELYRPIQALSESKESVLREGERQAIDDYLGNPTGFFNQLMSFDALTIGKMQKLAEALQRNREMALIGLDERTLGLLEPAMVIPTSSFTPPSADESSIRDPKMTLTVEEETQLQTGLEALKGTPIF